MNEFVHWGIQTHWWPVFWVGTLWMSIWAAGK